MKNQFSNSSGFVARLKHVEQLINHVQLSEAAEQLNQLVKTSPQDPRVFILGARLAEAAHNPQGTLQSAVKAYQLAPQWPVASLFLAGVLAEHGQGLEAMTLAKQAVQHATSQKALDHELLVKAADIAHRLSDYSQALSWLRQAQTLEPANTATAYKIGLTLSASGDFAAAMAIFTELLAQSPGSQSLLAARRQAALAAKDLVLAVQDAETLLAQDPANEEHQFYLAVVKGEAPATQPASVVALHFNSLAVVQAQQVADVHHTLAKDVAQRIRTWYPDLDADVLDLGCGTGALGMALGPMKGVLVGVDLAQHMLALAAQRQLYDKLHAVNLLDALRETPAEQYHVITALDVFDYVGDLTTVIPHALRILVPGGRLIFNCEASAEDDPASFHLSNNLRYTYNRAYVQRLLSDAGCTDIDTQDCEIHVGSAQPAAGFLVTVLKPVPATKKATPRKRAAKVAPAP